MTNPQWPGAVETGPNPGQHDQTRDSHSEEVLGRSFYESPISTVVVDSTGAIILANDRATETLGLSRAEITKRTCHPGEWNLATEDGSPITLEEHPVTRVFETGDPVYGFEHWLHRPDGSERWMTSNYSPILDDAGAVDYVIVSFEDVTALKHREERLTSTDMRRLEYRADESAVPPSLRVDSGERRIEVESVVSLPDGATVQYMGTGDLTAGEFITAVEEVPHITDVRLLSTIDGYSRLEARAESATVSEVFQALGGHPRSVVISHDEVRFLGEIPGDEDHRQVADGIRAFHPEAELVSEELVYSPHLLYDVVSDALTDRQLATLNAAYFSGYFESPRTSTGDELADRFGVTRQTFNQHLRKAQQIVFQHLFEKSGAAAR
ncbi:bacterio-opsin activator domain-containing protein [Natrarchaeobaculum sulfurireducens]|uniref:Signal transduction histidine kinase n=1 Tax=Natrarchaeobaculum sulfurireducens TaxID=2044521 RepID=A0A346PJJ2_9EURY|nr:bacterio-opsin activator domain-containing protein [Natrarchaeobaculum sulfurireducens]AXR79687.1 Signal transduction histidine kinase [Natrarchaeobaculum sulfurireducens]